MAKPEGGEVTEPCLASAAPSVTWPTNTKWLLWARVGLQSVWAGTAGALTKGAYIQGMEFIRSDNN